MGPGRLFLTLMSGMFTYAQSPLFLSSVHILEMKNHLPTVPGFNTGGER